MIAFDNITFLIPALVMLCWSIRIFFKENVHNVQLLMVAAMFISALAVICCPYLTLFIMPFYYVALRVQITSHKVSKWNYLIFLPAMICTSLAQDSVIYEIILYLQTLAITAWSFFALHKYRKALAEYYDTTDDSPAETFSQIVIFSAATMAITAIFTFLPDFIAESIPVIVIFSTFITLLVFMIGKYTYALGTLAITYENTENVTTDQRTTEDETKSIILHKELQRIEDEKMYLDPMLSLVSLAEKLNTNRTYLSNSIHKYHNQNFADFINTLRINHAIELMKKGGHNVNIKDVAISSGYNHLQSFYRNFATIMQMTPKTWLAKHHAEAQ